MTLSNILSLALLVTIIDATNVHTYDYIVVGAGTAGSALGAELSRDGDSVLLIEEGDWAKDFPNVVYAEDWFSTLTDPELSRGYQTIAQTELNDRIIWYPRAKVTGGCGSLNAMVWILGNRLDYDERWGIDDWTWDNDLKYYWHYIESTFKTEIPNDEKNYWIQKFIKSAQINGYRFNPDPNNLTTNGQGGVSVRRFMGELVSETVALRESSWTAYVEPILNKRNNLDVIVYTRVNKLLFDIDGNDIKATGVETYDIDNDKINNFFARKEVILSAGVIDSPKILMLSGVGKCDELEALDIVCIINKPGVGKNLQDHTITPLWSPPLKDQNTVLPPQPFSHWGVLAIDEDGEFYNSITVQRNFVDFTSLAVGSFGEPFHYESRGEVLLADNNPETLPIINPNYLSTINDQRKYVETVRKSRDLIYTTELMDVFEDRENEIAPGWHVQTYEEILEWGRSTASTDFHPAGTAKMGNDFTDENVVVDSRLRVKGINNLRVVDGSIMPELISGNPNQITMIVGFKGADYILEDNGGNGDKVYDKPKKLMVVHYYSLTIDITQMKLGQLIAGFVFLTMLGVLLTLTKFVDKESDLHVYQATDLDDLDDNTDEDTLVVAS